MESNDVGVRCKLIAGVPGTNSQPIVLVAFEIATCIRNGCCVDYGWRYTWDKSIYRKLGQCFNLNLDGSIWKWIGLQANPESLLGSIVWARSCYIWNFVREQCLLQRCREQLWRYSTCTNISRLGSHDQII